VTGDHNRQPSLWQIASHEGKKVLVLNVPMTYPPEPVNGIIVSGLPATELTTYPGELAAEIKELIPDYVVYPDPGQAYSDQGIDAFLERVGLSNQGLLTLWSELQKVEPWDFAMLVFNATDVVQHAMWRFMDPTHPRHRNQLSGKYQDAILDVYREMDQALAQIISTMDGDTTLVVMSDHGFGPFYKFFHVNTWLMHEGLLSINSNLKARLKSSLFNLGLSPMPIYEVLMRIGLGRFKREVVRGKGQGLMRAFFLSFDDVDWSKTLAYSYGNIGQIRVNLRGREPGGIVETGEEYDAVVGDIQDRLTRLKDPVTGELVVESIYERSEIYQGACVDEAPDLLFLPRRLEYFGFGEYEFGDHRVIAKVENGISGTHRMNGIGLAWGSKIKPGKVEDLSLEDFAPTILHLMGLQVPAHMDGRPLVEMIHPDSGLGQPKESPAWEGRALPAKDLSEEDEKTIRQRMRDLGYVA
jgi:predicted AlkP superfamily phosphohydrolase/phosphomutase